MSFYQFIYTICAGLSGALAYYHICFNRVTVAKLVWVLVLTFLGPIGLIFILGTFGGEIVLWEREK